MSFRLESQAEPIPGYKLIDRLGSGGFGEVWKATAPGGLLKAIKFVYGDLETSGEEGMRAEQELKALSRVKSVRHPYILTIERYDIVEGRLMIVMELADRNLWDRFKECRDKGLPGIPRDELLNYMEESAEALDLMNVQYQLQHLDIKPQNIFLVYNHIKVADFGLVKDLEGTAAKITGGVTPVYAAPETFDGMVSRFCDQYSLAIVYQELLTGQRPFVGTNIHHLIMQHVSGKPNLMPLPPEDREAIGRSLEKIPDQRFPYCRDLVKALRNSKNSEAALGITPPPAPIMVSQAVVANLRPQSDKMSEEKSGTAAVATGPSFHEAQTNYLGTRIQEVKQEAILGYKSAPPETTGTGELFPALVVGLGQTGLGTLQHLSRRLHERFGSLESLPNLRLLCLDTDPEALHTTSFSAGRGSALPGGEVVLARLNRASYYLKPREGRPRLETWFDTNMLYRIQRTQVTGGLRALGRLAFIDNYRIVSQRLQSDLEACLDPDSLAQAVSRSGLTLRTNQPRVYVVTSLGGGTGGGMFIDLAYVLRNRLRQLGYAHPEIVGLFFLPAVERNSVQKLALGNAFASLTELNHFSTSGVTFAARFDEREPIINDPEPPFDRCFFLSAPYQPEGSPPQNVVSLAGDFLYRNLVTPLGAKTDTARSTIPQAPQSPRTLTCQSFGMFRFTWPRRAMLRVAAQRFCFQIVERWLNKDAKPVREAAKKWVQEQWTEKEMGSEFLIMQLHKACEQALGKSPESVFSEVLEPMLPKKRWFSQGRLEAAAVTAAVNQLEEFLGRPVSSAILQRPAILEEILRKEAESLATHWQPKLIGLMETLVEDPAFRLAGAEEALRQLIELIEQVVQHHDPLSQEFNDKTAKGYERFQFLLPNLSEIINGGSKTAGLVTELTELLKLYPKWRYQSMILKVVNMAYTSLRGKLSDQLREVAFCRVRLADLQKAFEKSDKEESHLRGENSVHYLFPVGCKSLEEAVDYFVQNFTTENLIELDVRMQGMIKQQFRGLMHVCMTSGNLLKNLEAAMTQEATTYAGSHLQGDDVVAMYLAQRPGEEESLEGLIQAFDLAAPSIGSAGTGAGLFVVGLPASPEAEKFRELTQKAIADVTLHEAGSPDDIVFYREETQIALSEMEQLGPQGQDAYRQMKGAEHFTPHTRTDIMEWQGAVPIT